MAIKNSAFEVDMKGLRALQAGKPIWFTVRELIQNALDEDITECRVDFNYEKGRAEITVTDDNPNGFRDLSDAYTLFKDTHKRYNVKTRGRFNFGEKQVLSMCEEASIITTTGSVFFDTEGRHTGRKKLDRGSKVHVVIKMTKDQYFECINYCNSILVPENIKFSMWHESGGSEKGYRKPHVSFVAKLPTELMDGEAMRRTSRPTVVDVHVLEKDGTAYIYEMGIPVVEIDCLYNVNVQQKIPLNVDRDNVDPKYLKEIYAEVLNHTFAELKSNQSSDLWVRTAGQSERIDKEAVKDVFVKRYGDKAVIANPFDKKSIDRAITEGYRVIHSSELSGIELDIARAAGAIRTSSEEFPVTFTTATAVKPNEDMQRVANFCKLVYNEFVTKDKSKILIVEFIESDATCAADFEREEPRLRFNMTNLPKDFFELFKWKTNWLVMKKELIDLIIHELAHEHGTHYEKPYLDCITRLGAELTMKALGEPEYFNLKTK